jgi:hypothetical protein
MNSAPVDSASSGHCVNHTSEKYRAFIPEREISSPFAILSIHTVRLLNISLAKTIIINPGKAPVEITIFGLRRKSKNK